MADLFDSKENNCIAPKAARERECVLCGKCLTVCPLFNATLREELSPRAKWSLLGLAAASGGGEPAGPAEALAGLCLSCGRCEKACPFGLCVPDILGEVRAAHPGWRSFLWGQWVGRAKTLWPAAVWLSRIAPPALFPGGAGGLSGMIGALAAMDVKNALPPWLKPLTLGPGLAGTGAVVFPGCVGHHAQKGWLATALKLLHGLDVAALVPEFVCCGCTLGHAGLKKEQEAAQRRNLEIWREYGRQMLVVFCATCRCGLKSYARGDLGWLPGEAEQWARSIVSLAQLLREARFEVLPEAPERVIYHKPCHGAGEGADFGLLQRAVGERLVHDPKGEICCGFGGSMRLTAPGLSDQVALKAYELYGARPGDQLLTGCSGCAVQFKSHVPDGVTSGHWLEAVKI